MEQPGSVQERPSWKTHPGTHTGRNPVPFPANCLASCGVHVSGDRDGGLGVRGTGPVVSGRTPGRVARLFSSPSSCPHPLPLLLPTLFSFWGKGRGSPTGWGRACPLGEWEQPSEEELVHLEPVKVPTGRLFPSCWTGVGRGLGVPSCWWRLCSPVHPPPPDPLGTKGATGFLFGRRSVLKGSCPCKCMEGWGWGGIYCCDEFKRFLHLKHFFSCHVPLSPRLPFGWWPYGVGGDSV